MSRHTITADIEVSFTFPGLTAGEYETAMLVVDIDYDYMPGCAASWDDPSWSAECSIITARTVKDDGLSLSKDEVFDRAREWLNDEGYREACDQAEQDRLPDPDEAYERARDDAADGRL